MSISLMLRGVMLSLLAFCVGCVQQGDLKTLVPIDADAQQLISLNEAQSASKITQFSVTHRNKIRKLWSRQGVFFLQMGQETKILIPENLLFKKMTSQWRDIESAQNLLRDLSIFMRTYQMNELEVSSIITHSKHPRFTYAVAQSRAKKVSQALWRLGINLNLITSKAWLPRLNIREFNQIESSKESSIMDSNRLNQSGYLALRFGSFYVKKYAQI